MSAEYNADSETVTLVFDRAIDVAAFDGTQLTVSDPAEDRLYDGEAEWTLLDPVTLQITLLLIGTATSADVRMSATASTGIVAVDDGAAWAGASNLPLPWP